MKEKLNENESDSKGENANKNVKLQALSSDETPSSNIDISSVTERDLFDGKT